MRRADAGRRDALADLERGPVETSGYCDAIQNALLIESVAEAFVTEYCGHSWLRLTDAGRAKLAELRAAADAEAVERARYVWDDGYPIGGPFDSEEAKQGWADAWWASGHGIFLLEIFDGIGPENALAGPFWTDAEADAALLKLTARREVA